MKTPPIYKITLKLNDTAIKNISITPRTHRMTPRFNILPTLPLTVVLPEIAHRHAFTSEILENFSND